MTSPNRRDAMKATAVALAGSSLIPFKSPRERTAPTCNRVLRFAHLTDVHVQTERAGDQGFLAGLVHLQQQPDPPEFIMFGGDNLMNVDSKEGAEKADHQLATWNRCLKDGLSIPQHICIGNHDILNLDPVDGKKWATDSFGLDRRYYHFDRNGWRFIILDSTSPEEGGYKARLDEAQLDWLKSLLGETDANTPIIIVSHIPILSASTFFDGENEKSGDWIVPGSWMHLEARAIKDLFLKHENVRVSLSGHIHLVDEVCYNGVTYLCNGAVSGGWWKGPCQEFGNGYALIDLFDDGTVARSMVYFPWDAKP